MRPGVRVDFRTHLSDAGKVRAGEFVRRVGRLAQRSGKSCRFVAAHGRGSHGTLYFGDRVTVVVDRKRELTKDALHGMLRQLGLKLEDIQ